MLLPQPEAAAAAPPPTAAAAAAVDIPWPDLALGLLVMVGLTVAGILLTMVVALVTGLMRTARNVLVRGSARVFVDFFRSTSLLVQLFWLYFAFNYILDATVGYQIDKFGAAVLAVGLCYGAYASEIVRGSIRAVPKAQWEATTALSMTPAVRMRRVILPQALPLMVGPFSVTMVELLKGTSLVSLIALSDITLQAILLRNENPTQAYLIFGALLMVYYVFARLMTILMRFLERRARASVGGGPAPGAAKPAAAAQPVPGTGAAGVAGGVK
jgi:polar amino acid transport system permease protein